MRILITIILTTSILVGCSDKETITYNVMYPEFNLTVDKLKASGFELAVDDVIIFKKQFGDTTFTYQFPTYFEETTPPSTKTCEFPLSDTNADSIHMYFVEHDCFIGKLVRGEELENRFYAKNSILNYIFECRIDTISKKLSITYSYPVCKR